MQAENRLAELGYTLPVAAAPAARLCPGEAGGGPGVHRRSDPHPGRCVGLSRQGGAGLDPGRGPGGRCALHPQPAGGSESPPGDLDKIRQVVKLQAFVSSALGFDRQHIVVNAASELLCAVFGEMASHARTAIGTNQLPLDAPVEIEAIVEV